MVVEDIVSLVVKLPEVTPEVVTIHETINLVQHLVQVEQTDGLDLIWDLKVSTVCV